MENAILELKVRHFIGADYSDCKNCPVANSAKEKFKSQNVHEGTDHVFIGDIQFNHKEYSLGQFSEDRQIAYRNVLDSEKVIRELELIPA